jgi:hypothetical protein
MSEPRLPDLTRSFERHLRAENMSDRTIETYLEAVRAVTSSNENALSRSRVAPRQPAPWGGDREAVDHTVTVDQLPDLGG